MNEPWEDDFCALREHSRVDAPSLERTRRLVLASATTTEDPKEKTMSFLKRRPALAVAIAIALLAVLTPVAYAVVNKVFLTIDPDQSEQEIEQQVTEQLEAAGYPPSSVTAEKTGDSLKLGIRMHSDDPDDKGPDLDVSVGGLKGDVTQGQSRVQIQVECELTPAQMDSLTDLVSSDRFLTPLRDEGKSDAELAAELRAVLDDHGFKSAAVDVSGDDVAVTVSAPPG
jgi:hypothetical protein